mmetsp:Transcript_12380/g.19272  ORF Transcript_12380/g.19272 Transcript_12380/m.19272 type:complete len:119 (+) Transcript_12380:72-428(+)
MKICVVGQLKPKFIMEVNTDIDEVVEIKSQILIRLGMLKKDEGHNPAQIKKIRLFSLRGGLELMDNEHMDTVHGHKYLFYSFGEPFDHQVRMEFIKMQKKLGEGGFGSVYLAYDELIK